MHCFPVTIGIGRNPDYSLDIYNSSGTTSSATGTTMQRLWNYVGADLSQQKTFIDFVFQDDNDNEYPQVRIGAEVGQNGDANSLEKEGSGAFVVYTNNATGSTPGTNSLTERMRVDYAGNVGIGTTTPGASLDIEPSSGDADILLTAGSQTLRLDQNSIRTTTNNNLTLFTNGNSGQLVLQQSTGNVGIGNTNPSRNLTLGNGSGNSVLAIVASTTGLSQIGLGDSDDDNYGQIILRHSDGVLQIQNGGGGGITERGLNITSSENVGIGTTTPDAKLEVIATRTGTPSSDTNIKVTDDTAQAADVGGSINFTGKYTDAGVVLSGSPFIRASKKNATTGDYGYGLKFGVRGSGSSTSNVAMTIDSDSNVGIGTTSPDTLLHVYNPDTNWGAYSVITLGTDVEGTNQAQLKYYRGASTATESFQLSVRGTTALTALYNCRS